MATWITHIMIAEKLLCKFPSLDRRSFCVGSIAPDCNVENEDWTSFTPSREITHWMSSGRKSFNDCERFYTEYMLPKKASCDESELSFLLGYYSHLAADAEFARFVRDAKRLTASRERIKSVPALAKASEGMPESWESVKLLLGKKQIFSDINTIEAEYLESSPSSAYLTEILPLKSFPDYMEFLPKGAIVRKISVMGYVPEKKTDNYSFLAISRSEYMTYIDNCVSLAYPVIDEILKKS